MILLLATAVAGEVDLAEEAELHFRLGKDAYEDQDWRTALAHLLQSHRLVPNRNVAFNIGRAYEQLGDFDAAWRYYDTFVQQETEPGRLEAAKRAVERIRPHVALVRVTTVPDGATVFVDRRDLGPRGTTPLTLALPAGDHLLRLELDGHEVAEATRELVTGEATALELEMKAILGTLVVDGSPKGAVVSVDGTDVGTLPGRFPLRPGALEVVVRDVGYEDQRHVVNLAAKAESRLDVQLEARTGRLVVDTVVPGARIDIDGRTVGFTPGVLDVPEGPHRVTISLDDHHPVTVAVMVPAGLETSLDVPLRPLDEVTAAARLPQAAEDAPASVSVIGRREIRAFGYQTVYDALSATRGLYPTNDLSYQSLGFRGFERPGDYGNRVLTTVDGHAINDDAIGSSYVGDDLMVDLQDVDRIEVVRGPGSALYGTNAVFGVVNVVTRSTPSKPYAAATLDGERNVRGRVASGVGNEERGLQLGASGQYGDGGEHTFPRFDLVVPPGRERTRGVTAQARGWTGDLTVQSMFHRRDHNVVTGAFGTIPGSDDTIIRDQRAFVEGRYTPRIDDDQLAVRAWVDSYRFAGDYAYGGDSTSFERWDGVWLGLEPRYIATLGSARLTVGAEGRAYVVAEMQAFDDDVAYLDSRPTQQSGGAYVLGELGPEAFRATLGARYDAFTLLGGGAFNPRAAIVAKPGASDVLKAVAGTAYRAPSVYEQRYEDDGFSIQLPVDLGAERIATGELEWTHRLDAITSLVVAGYGNRITDLVELETAPSGLLRYANVDRAYLTAGGELELSRAWRRGSMLSAHYSFQRTRIGDLTADRALTNSPPHLAALKAAAPALGATLATRLRIESPRRTKTGEVTEWALLNDVVVTGEVADNGVEWGLGVRNLLDWRHHHPADADLRLARIQQPGRTFFATIATRR